MRGNLKKRNNIAHKKSGYNPSNPFCGGKDILVIVPSNDYSQEYVGHFITDNTTNHIINDQIVDKYKVLEDKKYEIANIYVCYRCYKNRMELI